MANSPNKTKKQNLKKKNDEENNEDSSQNEEEPNEETEQTEGDNINETDDQESVTENDTESEDKNNNNKKVKPLKGEKEEDSKKTTNSDPEKLDLEEENEEESKKLDDEESGKEDAKEIAEEETLSKETGDNTDDNDADIDLLLTKSQAEVTEDYLAATEDFLYLLHYYCSFALEDEESEHEQQQKIQDLIDQINSLLPHFPTPIHVGDYSSIDPEKIQDFLDKYSVLIRDYLAIQTKVLQTNLIGTKTELMQQVSVLAYKISTKLPDRDEVTENLRLAAAKLSYYCARYVITTSIKSFVQKLDYVPAIVKLAKDFIRDTIKLIKDPSTMTQKLLSNYLKNLDNNMNNLSVIFAKSNNKLSTQQAATKDLVTAARTQKAGNGAISTIAIETFLSSGAIMSLLGKKINTSIDPKNSKHHIKGQNHRDKILISRAKTKHSTNQTRG